MDKNNSIETKVRRIFAGYYKRYDGGLRFYVIRVVPDLITGEDVILCRNDSFKDLSYFVFTRKEFDSKVECDGKKVKKYYRDYKRFPISDLSLECIEMDARRRSAVRKKRINCIIRVCRERMKSTPKNF